MLKKLGLDQTKVYEKCLALEEISIMLVSFVNGRPHHLAIGAEQGDIDKWDDLVIKTNSGRYIHVQVKRQITDFSSDPITRDRYVQGKRKDIPRDLSPLDETLKSLGERIRNQSGSNDLQKEFWLELPESSTKIKEGLEIRHLRNLCEVQIKNITTPADLIALASKDSNAHNIYLWLTTWCDFLNWEHILRAFRILKIKTSGFETDIHARVKSNLSQIFKTTEIEQVHRLILSYLDENATFAGAIKPRHLLHELKGYLLPNIFRWTQFKTDGSSWDISGIHDLEDNNEIERSSVIVPSLWATGNPNARFLKIYGDCPESCLVSESLMRLSLHPQGSFDILCSDKSGWKNSIKTKTGGTLGLAKNDFNDLRILDGLEPSSPSEKKEFTTIDAKEKLAEELHNEMHKATLKLVNSAMLDKIREMNRGELRTEVESRWTTWKYLLENNVEEQRKLFSKILHPKAEGKSISGELRVGPKTAELLCEAVFLLLIVSVCLSDEDNKSWVAVTNKLKMTSVGLVYWSGPAEGTSNVIEIDDDSGIGKLLENESGQIIIIPQSELTDTEFFKDDISGDTTKRGLLTHPNYPKLLITKDRNFKKKLADGIISELREYFQGSLDKYENIRESAVNEVVR
ncbi:ABC-three component system protein [Pelosinus sp. sgz500959]|uniref:ABC-three component system protein n=1 Tax=Pelosinus sp. sgz500959 TaxID=3242472 RepID=UPI00366B2C27